MRLAILFLLTTLAAQTPHGPYADKEGWVCYRGETKADYKRVQCFCKAPCENDGMEDKACMTYCTSPKCVCHTDECDLERR